MGHMKQLYSELQETGWKEKEIKQIPDKLAWEMASSDKVKEKVKDMKRKGSGKNTNPYHN